ncbi:hypothetical protein DP129_09970 [Clostridium tetani]|uniref:Uncharacterized protein n=1 Tax=Clostridium tetani TaxID=1513 RepID=A0ABY0ENP9_CLOTA|nr:hypothetical protein DP129_09970 [Clostridium tetani]RXI55354.1 hypothetical protein DP131_08115 [Clostridium tetani]RXI68425.1 hypothetical protein DQN76_09155 [Clostridium tetani]
MTPIQYRNHLLKSPCLFIPYIYVIGIHIGSLYIGSSIILEFTENASLIIPYLRILPTKIL